jgi:hypothetical protein
VINPNSKCRWEELNILGERRNGTLMYRFIVRTHVIPNDPTSLSHSVIIVEKYVALIGSEESLVEKGVLLG